MKTKRISVYVNSTNVNRDNFSCQLRKSDHYNAKAEIIVHVPEKKVELTEKQLRDVLSNHIVPEVLVGSAIEGIVDKIFNGDKSV